MYEFVVRAFRDSERAHRDAALHSPRKSPFQMNGTILSSFMQSFAVIRVRLRVTDLWLSLSVALEYR